VGVGFGLEGLETPIHVLAVAERRLSPKTCKLKFVA
jgi:hypothetical protein